MWNSLSSLCVNILSGTGETLTISFHIRLIIPAELWEHITFILGCLWGILLAGGTIETEIINLCCLCTFAWTIPATSAVHFLAFAFLATTSWFKKCADRNRRPYEIRICDKCDWHTVQDEEHILLDCPHEHLVNLRSQHQLFFPPQSDNDTNRLRNIMNQPDVSGVASFVSKCPFPLISGFPDLLLANRSDTWAYQVLNALGDVPDSQHLLDAVRSRQPINVKQFELTLREHIIRNWRDLDNFTPYEAHHSSRIMRTYHTHFGVPLGKTPGWWDDRKRNHKPVLPLYLRMDIPSNLSRALSCLRLSCHNFLVQKMRYDRNRRPYELRICDKCDWHTVQDEEHILLDCPHEHSINLRTQDQLFFPPQSDNDTNRLRNFMNQPDVSSVASFVAECLALLP